MLMMIRTGSTLALYFHAENQSEMAERMGPQTNLQVYNWESDGVSSYQFRLFVFKDLKQSAMASKVRSWEYIF